MFFKRRGLTVLLYGLCDANVYVRHQTAARFSEAGIRGMQGQTRLHVLASYPGRGITGGNNHSK